MNIPWKYKLKVQKRWNRYAFLKQKQKNKRSLNICVSVVNLSLTKIFGVFILPQNFGIILVIFWQTRPSGYLAKKNAIGRFLDKILQNMFKISFPITYTKSLGVWLFYLSSFNDIFSNDQDHRTISNIYDGVFSWK